MSTLLVLACSLTNPLRARSLPAKVPRWGNAWPRRCYKYENPSKGWKDPSGLYEVKEYTLDDLQPDLGGSMPAGEPARSALKGASGKDGDKPSVSFSDGQLPRETCVQNIVRIMGHMTGDVHVQTQVPGSIVTNVESVIWKNISLGTIPKRGRG